MQSKRIDILLSSIEAERKYEEEYYLKVIAEKSIAEKVKEGVAVQHLEITNKAYSTNGQVAITLESKSSTKTFNRLKAGTGVMLTIGLQDTITTFKGTIAFYRKGKMKLLLNQELDLYDIPTRGKIYVELIYEERPYQIMKQTMLELKKTKLPHIQALRNGIEKQDAFDYDLPLNHYHDIDELNETQNKAIEGCLQAKYLGIIHGPPGTGKTTTIVGLVSKLLKSEKQILIAAPSNNAVDLLASKLDAKGINVLRIGHVTRVDENLKKLTLDDQIKNSSDWQLIKKMRVEGLELAKKAETYKRNFGPNDRKMRISLRKESRETMKWAKELEKRLGLHVIDSAQVVLATLIGVSHYTIKHSKFKTCIIDEASQALEPECWNVMQKAERTILVGDHKQLPPTVRSPKAIQQDFEVTLLDRMAPVIKHCHQLTTQYRMNEKILSFSNRHYYEDKLLSSTIVKDNYLPDDDRPVVYIDTSGTGYNEEQLPNEKSHFNDGEYQLIQKHILGMKSVLSTETIGIITPYAAQVRHIRKQLEEHEAFEKLNIVVDSIDGFQGQEKDVIYLSLVRSNDEGQIGFLKDQRRLNVALTRAKKKMVIIGDSATIANNPVYSDLIDHVEGLGGYVSAWELM